MGVEGEAWPTFPLPDASSSRASSRRPGRGRLKAAPQKILFTLRGEMELSVSSRESVKSVTSSSAQVGLKRRRKAQQLRVSLRGAGYEECGAVPDENQALDFLLIFLDFLVTFFGFLHDFFGFLCEHFGVSLRGAGYEECGAVPDEDQPAAQLVWEHVKLHIGPAGRRREDSTGKPFWWTKQE